MAIAYKEILKEKVGEDNSPFSTMELTFIDEAEGFIDDLITSQFNTDKPFIEFDVDIIEFNMRVKNPCTVESNKIFDSLTKARRKKMSDYLLLQYVENDWDYILIENDYRDTHPNLIKLFGKK